MNVNEIPAYENEFDSNGVDSNGKIFTLSDETIQIPDETGVMNYVRIKAASGDESYFYKSKFPKDQIVLHFTMGYLKGDIATLTQSDYHVSVPFIIGRNGKIYNLFYSSYWAYHLGLGSVGGNSTRSKRTIGIEISNIGPLKQTEEGMATYYTDIYCGNDQVNEYSQQIFRRFNFYANFTDAQYESLIILLRYLTSRYNIERKFLNEPERYKTLNDIADFGGIVSHVNYRPSGKEDLGPAFDWTRVIQGVS